MVPQIYLYLGCYSICFARSKDGRFETITLQRLQLLVCPRFKLPPRAAQTEATGKAPEAAALALIR